VVTAIRDAHRQLGHTIRLDWGTTGAAAIAPGYDVADVVDVLSFTTSVSVATDRGATVYPYRWRDETAELFAAAHAARWPVGRSEAGRATSASPRHRSGQRHVFGGSCSHPRTNRPSAPV
jgi:2-phosphosulfolactate phosphatase